MEKVKKINFLFILVAVITVCYTPLQAQTQLDNIVCLGNGSMAVYEQHANILQVFGPPYSAPSILQADMESSISVASTREPGTAIWTHILSRNHQPIGMITDFVIEGAQGFIRQIDVTDTISFTIKRAVKNVWIENTPNYSPYSITKAYLSKTPAGTFFYNTYPIPEESCHQIIISGNSTLSEIDDGTWKFKATPGKSSFYVVGGPTYPACILQTRSIITKNSSFWLNQTRRQWQSFSSRRTDFNKNLSSGIPSREKLIQTIDDVSVLIKTQQSTEGAVLAGHNYHLGYIRDQYGVSRGLLKLGYYSEAKSILQFYWNIWKRKGVLHNAQGIGVDAFHIHENDEVEQTGYLVIQAFDYLQKTHDDAFIKEISPMLYWAWESQKKNLLKYMLPFNGDETYVAGGILPRTALLDGSAESTMLFITCGDQLLNWVQAHQQRPAAQIEKDKILLQNVKNHYQENFIKQGELMANNPARMEREVYPEFRHGVCESMVQPCEIFGWTQRTANNRYLCALCYGREELPKAIPQSYFIQSVSLVPLYIHATILSNGQIAALVDEISTSYQQTGKLPSRPDGNITVGYDYGLFLFSLTALSRPAKDKVYKTMMNAIDQVGAWAEYYNNGRPQGTRYRPWESAINLEAAIEYAQKYNP